MNINKLPEGLWPVMLTPFLDNNQVDEEGLKKLTNFYIRFGANGLFANCLSSEMFQLTNEERLLVVKTVIAATKSQVPVIASGTFGRNLKQSSEFIKRMYDTGVAAVVLITNQLVEPEEGDEVLKKNIETLLKLTGNIPLGIYECPAPYKRLLTPAMIKWLGETGHFCYHKDTSCDMDAIKAKLAASKDTPLSLYNANTATALESLKFGAAGISPIGANLYPEFYSLLVNGLKQGKDTEYLVKLNATLSIMDAVVDQHYPLPAKLFLKMRGLPISTTCRIPCGVMKSENYLKVNDLMRLFKSTANSFNINMEPFVLD